MTTDFNLGWTVSKKGGSQEKKVTLPYDAMIHEERYPETNNGERTGFYPGGCYLYRKKFAIKEELSGKQVLLHFGGVYGDTEIILNGKNIFRHRYGFTPFDVDITDFLCGDENEICVTADNSYTPNCRWYSGSGIIRPVTMRIREKVHIEDIRITTVSTLPAQVRITASLQGGNREEEDGITVEIMDNDRCLYKGKTGVIPLEGVQLWSAQSPKLYLARLTSGKDCAEVPFGIRRLEWSGERGLSVNGVETKLRGCCIHSDLGVLGAAVYPDAEYRRIKILKDAGYNAVRSAHNPCSEEMLEACDRLGMYVLDELYDGWYTPKNYHDSSRHFRETWKEDMEAMVGKDLNHPCVIMYSIGNEVTEPGTAEGVRIGRQLAEEMKKLDESRPVTCALNIMLIKWNAGMKEKEPYRREHLPDQNKDEGKNGSELFNAMMLKLGSVLGFFCRGRKSYALIGSMRRYLDVVGLNYGEQRYDEDARKHGDMLIVGTETLIGSQWYNYPRMMKYRNVAGDFIWTGFDYIGETHIGHWVYKNRKGLPHLYGAAAFDITGHPDAMLYYQQAVWGVLEHPYLGVRPLDRANTSVVRRNWRMTDVIDSWTWHGHEGEGTRAEIFTDAPFVKLIQNGRTVGIKKVRRCRVSFQIKYEPGILRAVSMDLQKQEISASELVTYGRTEALEIVSSRSSMRTNGKDLCFAEILLTDGKGNAVACEDRQIRIHMPQDTEIRLAGFGSADPATEEGFVAHTHRSWYGRALAIFQAGCREEKIRVCISAEGIEKPAYLELICTSEGERRQKQCGSKMEEGK